VTPTATSNRRRSLALGTRIFLATALLVALSVGTAVAVTSVLIGRIARSAVADALEKSAAAQKTLQEQRYGQLQLISKLFVSDPYLRAYLAESSTASDVASILDLLEERRQQGLENDFAIVLDTAGRVIARTDRPTAVGEDLRQRSLVAEIIEQRGAEPTAGMWQERNKLYEAVAGPLVSDFEPFAYLVTGFEIDADKARAVKDASGADVAYIAMMDGRPAVVATTLEDGAIAALLDELRGNGNGKMMAQVVMQGQAVEQTELEVRGESLLASLTPLMDARGRPVGAVVAVASLEDALAPYRQIQWVLLAAGLVSILVAGGLSWLLARRALAPVRRLAAAAEAARQGDYSQRIAVDRADEVGQLAGAFDELLSDLREKRDMAAYVTELSRTLPEPAGGRALAGPPQARETLLLAVELRGYGRARPEPGPTLERLAADLRQVSDAVTACRGQIEETVGQRVLARFEGEGRAFRALSACARLLAVYGAGEAGESGEPGAPANAVEREAEAPLVALSVGRVVIGPVTIGESSERALVGLPVQQLESLKREATPGEVMLTKDVHEELRPLLDAAGVRLSPRRGLVSPQPFFVFSAKLTARLAGTQSVLPTAVRQTPSNVGVQTGLGTAAPTLSSIEPGALMAHRFEILSVLGSGGMGVVYKARDRELDDLVALKVLRRDLWGDVGHLDRLKSELKLARKITHPNVLRTFDFGEIDGIPYISMEYVRGVTLRYLLDQTQRLPYSAGLRLGKQLCAGLGAAHAVGVMHRDIKPENLILEPTGNAKLMDFGIARPIARLTPGQTQAGFVVGTPQYLSPEQLQGGEVDARADIYSCGIVLYEIFTGKLPFEAQNAMDMMLKHLQSPPIPPRERWPEIPPRLEQFLLRCLEKEPAARYRTVDELLHDLETLSA
jgi:eukaryotic-like serine/threonine-protein kinase